MYGNILSNLRVTKRLWPSTINRKEENFMRKIAYTIIALIIVLNLMGCGMGGDTPVKDTSPTPAPMTSPTPTPTTTTSVPTDAYYRFATGQMTEMSRAFTSIGDNTEGDLTKLKADVKKLTAIKLKFEEKETPVKYAKFSDDIIKGIECWEKAIVALEEKDQKSIEKLTKEAKDYIDNAVNLLNEV